MLRQRRAISVTIANKDMEILNRHKWAVKTRNQSAGRLDEREGTEMSPKMLCCASSVPKRRNFNNSFKSIEGLNESKF